MTVRRLQRNYGIVPKELWELLSDIQTLRSLGHHFNHTTDFNHQTDEFYTINSPSTQMSSSVCLTHLENCNQSIDLHHYCHLHQHTADWLRASSSITFITDQTELCVCLCSRYKFNKHREKSHKLTLESQVDSLDSPIQNTAASLLNHSGCCNSGPDVSDVRGWTSELRRWLHSESLRVHSPSVCEYR